MRLNTALKKSIKTVGLSEPDDGVRESVALFLFQKKLVSIGKAAELANMGLAQFMELLKSLNIPQAEYTQDDLSMDISALKNQQYENPSPIIRNAVDPVKTAEAIAKDIEKALHDRAS